MLLEVGLDASDGGIVSNGDGKCRTLMLLADGILLGRAMSRKKKRTRFVLFFTRLFVTLHPKTGIIAKKLQGDFNITIIT